MSSCIKIEKKYTYQIILISKDYMLSLTLIYKICGRANTSVSSINLLSKNINEFFVKNLDIYVRNLSYIERHILFLNACLKNKQDYIDATLPLVDPSTNDCQAINFAIQHNNIGLLDKLLGDERVDFNRYMTPYILGIYGEESTIKYLLDKDIYTAEVFAKVLKEYFRYHCSLDGAILYFDYIGKLLSTSKIHGADYRDLKEKYYKYLFKSNKVPSGVVEYMIKNYELYFGIAVYCICNINTTYEKYVILAEYLKKFNQIQHLSNNLMSKLIHSYTENDKILYLLNNLSYTNEEINKYILDCAFSSTFQIFLKSTHLKTLREHTLANILKKHININIELVFNDPRSHYYIDDDIIEYMMDKGLTVLVSNLVNNKNIKLKKNHLIKRLCEDDTKFKEYAENEIRKRFRKS
jgi:hypothetical protein